MTRWWKNLCIISQRSNNSFLYRIYFILPFSHIISLIHEIQNSSNDSFQSFLWIILLVLAQRALFHKYIGKLYNNPKIKTEMVNWFWLIDIRSCLSIGTKHLFTKDIGSLYFIPKSNFLYNLVYEQVLCQSFIELLISLCTSKNFHKTFTIISRNEC